MRLGLILTTSFLLLAGIVALVGYLYKISGDTVQKEMAELRQSSIAQAVGAAEMRVALHESQLAAQQIITARLQVLVQPDHETGPLAGLDDAIDSAEDSLDEFERWLARTRSAALSTGEPTEGGPVESLVDLDKQYAVYKAKMDRFVHLSEYHPTDQVSEFFVDELQSLFESELVPLIRSFGEHAESDLSADLDLMESAHRRANRRNWLVAVAAFVSAVTLGLVIARSISEPLNKLQEAAVKVGKGELGTRVEVSAKNEIGVLAAAFNHMVDELEASTVSRSYLDNIIQSMSEMLVVTDSSGRVRTANRATLEILGFESTDLVGQPIDLLLAESRFSDLTSGESVFLLKAGGSIPIYCSRSDLIAEDGALHGVVLVAQNLTERKETQAQLRASVEEKEVLLREVHHRVKNNLQIVSSLLNLQDTSSRVDGSTGRILRESRNRIRSMALIHEQLYNSKDLARIDFSEYAKELVHYLGRSFDLVGKGIELQLAVDSQSLPVDQAIPCGMIINELVANGVEHAYPEGGGEIRIAFQQNAGRGLLTVGDDGQGLPSQLDPKTAETLGLRLIWALGEQLQADVEFDGSGGTEVRIGFEISPLAGSQVSA